MEHSGILREFRATSEKTDCALGAACVKQSISSLVYLVHENLI